MGAAVSARVRLGNGTNNVGWTFGYNPASQIVTETRDNDNYAYGGLVAVDRPYAVNGLNQYTTAGPATFTYDPNGNLTKDGTNDYLYDVENRLVKATTGSTVTNLTYDPLGRLFQVDKGTSSTTTKFLYDGDALVLEFNSSNGITNRYVHGSNAAADDPLVWYEGSTLSYKRWLHADHLGSIVAATSKSLAGSSPSINSYDEYGIPASTNTGRFQYTGQAWLGEIGMYHYKARIYSPTLGRFLQTDPVGYEGGINLYAYVEGDPINKTDPDGLLPPDNPDPKKDWASQTTQRLAAERRDNAVRVTGGTPAQRTAVGRAMQRVFTTPRGKQIQERAAITPRQERIVVVNDRSNAGANYPKGEAYIDPDFHPPIATADGPVPASTERIIAHELGHSVMGDHDDGPGRMNNINRNENPVAKALGEPERTKYERPRME